MQGYVRTTDEVNHEGKKARAQSTVRRFDHVLAARSVVQYIAIGDENVA